MSAATGIVIKRPSRKVKAVASPVLVLTQDESIVLGAFRTMDARRKRQFIATMPLAAVSFPFRAAPALRLIVGGAA